MGSGRQSDTNYTTGRMRIVRDAQTGNLVEVVAPEANYLSPPIHSSGMPAFFSAQNVPQNANIEFGSSREFSLYAYLEAGEESSELSPFDVQPDVNIDGVPFGSVTAVGKLIYGEDGTSRTQIISLSPGMATKVPLVGSSARFGPMIVPKYYNPDDTNPANRVYKIGTGAGSYLLTNSIFNNPDPAQTFGVVNSQTNPGYQDALTRSALCLAYLGRGSQYGGDSSPKFARRFYGTLRPGGAGATATTCPIAYGATQILLLGAPTLQFTQVSPVDFPGVFSGNIGPFNANVQAQAMNDLVAVRVTSTAPVAQETPFEIHYFLGL